MAEDPVHSDHILKHSWAAISNAKAIEQQRLHPKFWTSSAFRISSHLTFRAPYQASVWEKGLDSISHRRRDPRSNSPDGAKGCHCQSCNRHWLGKSNSDCFWMFLIFFTDTFASAGLNRKCAHMCQCFAAIAWHCITLGCRQERYDKPLQTNLWKLKSICELPQLPLVSPSLVKQTNSASRPVILKLSEPESVWMDFFL